MERDTRNLISEEFVIKLYPTARCESPVIEIKGCAFLNTERLGAIVSFFEEQIGQSFIAKIELEAELW